MYLCIVNMRASWRYIHESKTPFASCGLPLNIILLNRMGINNYVTYLRTVVLGRNFLWSVI